MNIAIIPARGGSKRIPRKNIKLFNGKPIIGHVIERALKSGCIDRIIVSTDDQEIAEIAKSYGAEVPFLRPPELSDDHATTAVVISHALNWLITQGQKPDYACVIYATAPFIQSQALSDSFSLLKQQPNKKFCFGVTEFPSPIQRAFKITKAGDVVMFQPEHFNSRSQDLEKAYHDAGQFYWGTTDGFFDSKGMFSTDAIPFPLPCHQVQDIDTPDDWVRAEALFQVMTG
ncbi:pseudaminic acid cytidylyltransferase [Shewanella olleyana]|uniref:pseudaminic acid cytidylyltransferase n=1 Tax=Shewanella olleyana TaxID=135626 RepID=UPI00200FE8CA|nr:pseudaminic acid cytidylyltransferase [Shewanella olleyana]MCL1066587.1 pseudaminic acid cytidylyltransferase [Shewanella olleyana]